MPYPIAQFVVIVQVLRGVKLLGYFSCPRSFLRSIAGGFPERGWMRSLFVAS